MTGLMGEKTSALLLVVFLALGVNSRADEPGTAQALAEALLLPMVPAGDLDPGRLCRTCEHFDLEEGQALAAQHTPFMMAAQHVSPLEMGAVATPDGEIEARDIPAKAQWRQFGLCGPRGEGIWGGTDGARRERMQGDDGVEGTFLAVIDGGRPDCYRAKSRTPSSGLRSRSFGRFR